MRETTDAEHVDPADPVPAAGAEDGPGAPAATAGGPSNEDNRRLDEDLDRYDL